MIFKIAVNLCFPLLVSTPACHRRVVDFRCKIMSENVLTPNIKVLTRQMQHLDNQHIFFLKI